MWDLLNNPKMHPRQAKELTPEEWKAAARDLAYLRDRGYPTQAALKLVGDRFNLPKPLRELLLRAVVPREIALARRRKLISPKEFLGKSVGLDGYNVLGTLVHGLKGYPLVLCRDGVVRDAVKAGSRLKIQPYLDEILPLLYRLFRRFPPSFLGIYLDAPLSGSGELARELRKNLLRSLNLPGEVLAIPDAERRVLLHEVVCTADGPLMDQARLVCDLAGYLLRRKRQIFLLKPIPPVRTY